MQILVKSVDKHTYRHNTKFIALSRLQCGCQILLFNL